MILSDLIYLLIFGVCCYWIKAIFNVATSKKSQNRGGRFCNKGKGTSKSLIRKELDNLLTQYKQGIITEQQYYKRANALIDKISDLYSDVVWTY